MLLSSGLVNKNDNYIARVMNGEGGNKCGKIGFFIIAANLNFFGGTGFAANPLSAGFGELAGTVCLRGHQTPQ